MALLLVVGAGLMAKSYWRTVSRDPGFDPHGLLAVGIVLPQAGYTPEEKVDLVTRLARRVEGLPGVDGTGIASRPPYLLDNSQTRFSIEGRGDVLPGEEGPTGSHMMADAALLRMLGVRVVSGRLFDGTDVADGPPVALVDETLARRYWPGEDAVGRRIRFGATDSEFRTIVGVVSAVRFDGPTVEAPTFFENPDQATRFAPFHLGSLTLMVRTEGDPLALAGPVRDALRGLDPSVPVSYVSTLEALRSQAVAGPRFTLVLLGAFALAALLLGAVGIAGVMAQAVAQRTREIGVRRALGATAGAVERLVLTRGLRLAGAGMGVGLLGALALNRILEGFLFEVSTVDAGTYALVTLVVAVAAGLATAVPARRATRIDPVEALRGE